MGKLGDLIVRLQLKHDDYKKGLKQAEKDTKGFGAALSNIKAVGVAVWAAIGASVISFGKQLIKSSQTIGDAWARMTSQIKAGWDVFVQSVGAMNWDNFIGRIKEATVAAKALTNALDAEFEISNSIKLQKSAMAEELAALEILARDQTKSYEQRAEAAQKYLDMVKPLYDQELELAKKLENAHFGKYLAGSGIRDNEQVRAELRNFLVDIGKNQELADKLGQMLELYPRYKQASSTQLRSGNVGKKHPIIDEYKALNEDVNKWALNAGYSAVYGKTGTRIFELFRMYNDMRNDEDTKLLVDAIIRANEAAAAFDRETKKMQTALNSSLSQINKESGETVEVAAKMTESLEKLPNITAPALQMNLPDIIPDDWLERNRDKIDAAVAEAMRLQGITEEINKQFNDAVVNSLSGATQALVDCIMGIEGADASQVLAALLKPFGQTMISLGEMLITTGLGIEVFKKSFKELKGAKAIAAGVGLIALGSALTAGIQALAGSSSGTTGTTGTSASASTSTNNMGTYQQEITVHVVGEISGDKIVLAGQKTLNKWNR